MKIKVLLFLIPALTGFFSYGQSVETIKIPPGKDTVIVTSTTVTTVIPAQVTTKTVLSAATIPTNPGPGPLPGDSGELAFTFIPETGYLDRPFAGPENWNGQNYLPVTSLDLYFRFLWTQLEGPTEGSYNWTVFDNWINQAIRAGQRFSFGIFLHCPGGCDPFNGPVVYDGFPSGYPLYLHRAMQSEAVKDAAIRGAWVPNWNSPALASRLRALLSAIAEHINTGAYLGKRYKDAVNYIDVRIMGSYGEWHHAGIVDNMNQYPTGMRPLPSSYRSIINAHIETFQDNPLVMLLAALDAERLNNTLTPVEITDYILKARNNWGLLGIRADQQGSAQWNYPDNYVHQYMENNFKSWQGGPMFNTLTMTRWKYAPLVGEPENNNDNPQLPNLKAQALLYHRVSVGNGNYKRSAGSDANMRAGIEAMGYRVAPVAGRVKWNSAGLTFQITWQNSGITPVYENWDTKLLIYNSSGSLVRAVQSSFAVKLFLPGAPVGFTDSTGALPPGSYTIRLVASDPTGYRSPLPLFIKGRNQDGSYTLGAITVK